MIENSPTSDSEPAGQPDAYARIGACLKEQRTRLGLSRADVGQRLHLAGMIIDDIEKGHVKDLPALYRHGYIRNYARLLELDADALLAEVRDDQPPMLRRVLPPPDAGYHFDKYLKITTYVLVSTMIIPPLLYFSVAGGARIFERDSQEIEVVETSPEAPDEAGQPNEVSVGSTEQSTSRSTRGHVTASALPLSAMRPVRTQSQTGEPAPSLAAAAMESSAPGKQLPLLAIELVDDSWIEIYDADGERLEYDLLREGQQREYQGQPPFRLLLGRANAVRLALDDVPVVWEGQDRGDVTELEVMENGEVR